MGRPGRLLAVSLCVVSAHSLAGYGEYCPSPTAVTPAARAAWAEEPWCDARGVQDRANYTNRDEAYLNEFQVVDLSQPEYSDLFCCTANYTAIIALNATVEALDAQAQKYYEAADRLLSRYNCEDFYPFLNCTPCQYAYRTWVCSIMFPRKCRDAPSYGVVGHVQKVCKDVCYEVVRKCPVELEFHCPTDDSYGDWGTMPDTWNPAAQGPFHGHCNPMQYNIDAAVAGVPSAVLLLAASAAVLVAVGVV